MLQESKPHSFVPQTAQSDLWQNIYPPVEKDNDTIHEKITKDF